MTPAFSRRHFTLLEELDLRRRGEDLARGGDLQRRLSGDDSHVAFSNRLAMIVNFFSEIQRAPASAGNPRP